MCLMSQKSGTYGEEREPDSYYICMFMVEREKKVKEIIREEKARKKP